MTQDQPPDARGPGRAPVRLLAALAGAGLLGFLILKLWSEVAEGETNALDRAVLLALRVPGHSDAPIGPAWLPEVMINVSSMGSAVVLGFLIAAATGFLIIKGAARAALTLVSATGSGAIAVALLKTAFARPRPELVAHLVQAQSMSFPSGHAANSALVYLTIAALLTNVERDARARLYIIAVAIAMTLAIGLSRLYLGVHWPSDVAAGWALGAGWAALWRVASSRFLEG
jgi:undecaprenyl-diphosphatase